MSDRAKSFLLRAGTPADALEPAALASERS
jgi:hypothetical protein